MLDTESRLRGMMKILIASNEELTMTDAAGFIAVPPELLQASVLSLLDHTDISHVSLDLGCGNGGWTLLAAAAGFPSYGIEINPVLVEHAQRNYTMGVAAGYIDARTPCELIVGDMIPIRFCDDYLRFRRLHDDQLRSMPLGAVREDSYSRLPVSIATADIIYCWAWPTQSGFLYNMLEDEAKKGALFVLPSYQRYILREESGRRVENRLLLKAISDVQGVFTGKRQ